MAKPTVSGARVITGALSGVRTKLPFEQSFGCPDRFRLLPLRLGQKSADSGHSCCGVAGGYLRRILPRDILDLSLTDDQNWAKLNEKL